MMMEANTNTTIINNAIASLEAATPPTKEEEDPAAVPKHEHEEAKFRLSTFDAVMHICISSKGISDRAF